MSLITSSISHALMDIRINHLGISQRKAASMLGITAVHLCNLENGKSTPTIAMLARYEEVFGVRLRVEWEVVESDGE